MTTERHKIERIPRRTLASIAAEKLRELVLAGDFEPGAHLSEVEIAERFGVSRGPIREALQRLVREGLLRSEPHRGHFVPVVSDEDIADIWTAREAIEVAAARLVLARNERSRTAKTLLRITEGMRRAAANERWDDVADLDMQFHEELVKAAQSPRLSRMFATVIDETRSVLSMYLWYQGREQVVDEHVELAAAVEAGDETRVFDALRHHFAESNNQVALRRPRGGSQE